MVRVVKKLADTLLCAGRPCDFKIVKIILKLLMQPVVISRTLRESEAFP